MRVVSLHRDAIVATSAIWQTNCIFVRGGEECFVIDSPILPEELDALPALLAQSGFLPGHGAAEHGEGALAPTGLLATHGDWDHLLGRLAFPGTALGCAQSTAERMRAKPGEAQRELRAFDEEHYVQRAAPLTLGSLQALPVPGRCELGERQLELHPAGGHTVDGMAIVLGWAGILLVGDYLSAVEIPYFGEGEGTCAESIATLERLRPLVGRVERVVPGHGPPLDRARALELLEEDLAYLRAVREHGAQAQLPLGRRTAAHRRMHAENVASLAQP